MLDCIHHRASGKKVTTNVQGINIRLSPVSLFNLIVVTKVCKVGQDSTITLMLVSASIRSLFDETRNTILRVADLMNSISTTVISRIVIWCYCLTTRHKLDRLVHYFALIMFQSPINRLSRARQVVKDTDQIKVGIEAELPPSLAKSLI